jgi:hypothetical protein
MRRWRKQFDPESNFCCIVLVIIIKGPGEIMWYGRHSVTSVLGWRNCWPSTDKMKTEPHRLPYDSDGKRIQNSPDRRSPQGPSFSYSQYCSRRPWFRRKWEIPPGHHRQQSCTSRWTGRLSQRYRNSSHIRVGVRVVLVQTMETNCRVPDFHEISRERAAVK